MRSDEARALGTIAGDVISGGSARAEEMHRAIARRVFSMTGEQSASLRSAHHAISGGAYAAVRGVGVAAGRTSGAVVGLTRPADAPSLGAGARGSALLGALNGAFGDTIHARHPALSMPLAVRRHGEDVPLEPAALRQTFAAASPRIVVFVHGLGETERSWRRRAAAHGRGRHAGYPTLLEEDLGVSAVVLRYNSGRHISENGEALAELLERLCAAWPVRVREIAVVGHSMGGLVARSACHHGRSREHRWTPLITHLVCLGTPHLGAPLERATNGASWALGKLPETRPLARLLNLRAAGVKDLRFGALLEEHWAGRDPDALWQDSVEHVDELAHATHFCVSSNLGSREDHLLGRLLGDVLVPRESAAGSGHARRPPLRFDGVRHFPGLCHFDLLNHPAVYTQLLAWLAPRPQPLLGPGGPTALLAPGPS